jgi:arylsulfatase
VGGVVLVVLDAARAGALGAYGGRHDVTPHLDELARESWLFEQAFTPAVYTRAAMTALWTSREPTKAGRRHAVRLPEVLQARGVRTAGFVANPNAGRSFGYDRGFDAFDEVDGVPPPPSGSLVEGFGRFLDLVGDQRFFVYIHLREPHFPFTPPPPFAHRFGAPVLLPEEALVDPDWIASLNLRGGPTPEEAAELRRAYEANLAYADELVGRIRAHLSRAGRAADTALIVTADHGEALGEHGHVGHNDQAYAESAHVPLLLHARGLGARRSSRLVGLLDIAPTVTQLFGAHAPSFEGVSLLDRTGSAERTLSCVGTDPAAVHAVRDARYSLVVTGGRTELFDRRTDPEETVDLAAKEPALLARLARRAPQAAPTLEPEASAKEETAREALRALGYVK